MFKFWGSQEQQVDPRPQEITTNSWYPPSVVSSPSSSNPATPNSSNSDTHTQRVGDRSHLSSPVSPTEAAGIIVYLKDKSVDELRKLLSNQEAYQQFLLSIDPVRTQNNVRNELRNETMQLATSAEEKLNDLTKRKAEILKYYSPGSLLHKLQECMDKTDKESEALHEQLLGKEIDLATFVQKYKQLRNVYHKRSLTYLAAKTSLGG
ncbi:Modifier of rudimentary, Modr [Cynara cardunculus var. scolymus]|uniref:Modifier of rudimentary, Modr n=1 Tax=Cynara cardunculus var. scolymus TaxID=59895 RepID=A0A103Y0C3_CYNCS|nr:Modifier of rudimentary, Modr [Cynara cardunculus var. scolymus]